MPAPGLVDPERTRMVVKRAATYRRLVTWKSRFGSPALYTARLVIRRRLADTEELLDIATPSPSLILGIGEGTAITTTIKLTPAQTSALPVGSTFVASLALYLAADPTENWVVTWPVSVEDTAILEEP